MPIDFEELLKNGLTPEAVEAAMLETAQANQRLQIQEDEVIAGINAVADTIAPVIAAAQERAADQAMRLDAEAVLTDRISAIDQEIYTNDFEADWEDEMQKRALMTSQIVMQQDLQNDYNMTMNDTLMQLDAIKAAERVGLGDIIKNPITAFETRTAGREASRVAEVNIQRMAVIDAAQQTNTAMYQNQIDALGLKQKTGQAINKTLSLTRGQLGYELVNIMRQGEIGEAQMALLSQTIGLSEKATDTMRLQLQALQNKGDLNLRTFNSLVQTVATKNSMEMMDREVRNAERVDGAKELLDQRVALVAKQIGLTDITGVDSWRLALQSELVSPEQVVAMQIGMNSMSGLEIDVIESNPQPYNSYQVWKSLPGSNLTPELEAIISGLISEAVPNLGTISASTPAGQEATSQALNNVIRNVRPNARRNIDTLYSSGVLMILNPKHAKIGGVDGIPGVSVQGTAALAAMDISATNWRDFSSQAIRLIADQDPSSYEQWASDMAAYAKYHLDDVNLKTRFGLTQMQVGGVGDATKASEWFTAIQMYRASAERRMRIHDQRMLNALR